MRPDIGDYAVIFGMFSFVAIHLLVALGLTFQMLFG